jgi:soluble cytochrome b562
MNPRIPLLALLMLCIAAPVAVKAQENGEGAKKSSELGDAMETMNGSFRKLSRQVANPAQNEASLALVAKIRTSAEESSKYLPAKIAKLPADAQEAAKTSYNDKMKKLVATIDELATALKAGKNDEAAKLIEDLKAQEDAGHREFRPKKKKKE